MRRSIIAMALYPPFVADCCGVAVEVVLLVADCCGARVEAAVLVAGSCEAAVLVAGSCEAAVVVAVDAGLADEVELELEPELEAGWSAGLAVIDPSALDMMPLLATVPFDAVDARKLLGSGAWMFAIACCTPLPGATRMNAAAPGAGMIIPIPAARRSILASSLSDATLARSS
jgi:hypothetical protein